MESYNNTIGHKITEGLEPINDYDFRSKSRAIFAQFNATHYEEIWNAVKHTIILANEIV